MKNIILRFKMVNPGFFKLTLSILVAVILSPILHLFEKYVFSDWQTAAAILVALCVDGVVGVYKHIKLKTVSSKGFAKFFDRIIKYGAVLIILHLLVHFVFPAQNTITDYFSIIVRASIFISISLSVLENLYLINPESNFPPPFLMKIFKSFQDTGDVRVFKDLPGADAIQSGSTTSPSNT